MNFSFRNISTKVFVKRAEEEVSELYWIGEVKAFYLYIKGVNFIIQKRYQIR